MSRRAGLDVPGIRKSRRRMKKWLQKTILTVLLVLRIASIPTDILTQSGYNKIILIPGHTVFTLPDGSSGVVFAGGTIGYTPDFNTLLREITLTGSALVHVAPGDKMLTAYIPGGIVRMPAGTFEVKAIPGDESKVRVIVGTGNAEIFDLSGKSLGYLHAAEEAILNLALGEVTRVRYDDVFISDTNIRPILRFDDMTLADVAVRLESHYGVRVKVNRTLRKYIINAYFAADLPLTEALEAISESNRDRYVMYTVSSNGVVTIGD
jgi:hypothetical protein